MTLNGEENWTCNNVENYEVRNSDCLTPLKSDNIHVNQNGDIVISTSRGFYNETICLYAISIGYKEVTKLMNFEICGVPIPIKNPVINLQFLLDGSVSPAMVEEEVMREYFNFTNSNYCNYSHLQFLESDYQIH